MRSFLISGDSEGDLIIWDSTFGTQLKKFSSLKGDILDIEINDSFSMIYATGIDSRILSI